MSVSSEKLAFSYGKGSKRKEVLSDVSFCAADGELVALLGANGAGKSTLFKCILGILDGYSGEICIDGEKAEKLTASALAKKIAYIPQLHYPAFNYSVIDMVLMGMGNRISPFSSPGRKELEDAYRALDEMGIAELSGRDFIQLSGGEQQLVLMARAMAQNAKNWILDEPVANLDLGNQFMVQEKLKALAGKGYTILLSSHDPEQTFMFADRVVALKDGKVLAEGSPGAVLTQEVVSRLYGTAVFHRDLCEGRARTFLPEALK